MSLWDFFLLKKKERNKPSFLILSFRKKKKRYSFQNIIYIYTIYFRTTKTGKIFLASFFLRVFGSVTRGAPAFFPHLSTFTLKKKKKLMSSAST